MAIEIDPGAGGSDLPAFPYGPGDPQPGAGEPPPAPPPPPPPPPPPRAPYTPTRPSSAQAPTAAPDPVWDGVASGYKTELEDLALQWQQVAGFGLTIDEASLRKMADAHVVSMRDFGQYMWTNLMPTDLKDRAPWLAWGIDQSTWNRQLSDYTDTYEQITGDRPNFAVSAGGQMDAPSSTFWDAFTRNLTQSGLREKLLHDEGIKQTFGWVRFGLDFDTFQQRKTDMRLSFGVDLSNDQAVLQLQYLHQSAGASRSVQAVAPPGQQQGPVTPTEAEVR